LDLPDIRPAGYPAKTVYGASLLYMGTVLGKTTMVLKRETVTCQSYLHSISKTNKILLFKTDALYIIYVFNYLFYRSESHLI
jgi:hypothetical protein